MNKWEIWEYTLPQIAELMKQSNRYIQFEVSTRMDPFGIFGGSAEDRISNEKNQHSFDDGEYKIATEEDIQLLEQFLSGM